MYWRPAPAHPRVRKTFYLRETRPELVSLSLSLLDLRPRRAPRLCALARASHTRTHAPRARMSAVSHTSRSSLWGVPAVQLRSALSLLASHDRQGTLHTLAAVASSRACLAALRAFLRRPPHPPPPPSLPSPSIASPAAPPLPSPRCSIPQALTEECWGGLGRVGAGASNGLPAAAPPCTRPARHRPTHVPAAPPAPPPRHTAQPLRSLMACEATEATADSDALGM